MSYRLLEKRTGDKYEQVKFFDTHLAHYAEGDGWTKHTTHTYASIGMSQEKCVQQYLQQGFMEVNDD